MNISQVQTPARAPRHRGSDVSAIAAASHALELAARSSGRSPLTLSPSPARAPTPRAPTPRAAPPSPAAGLLQLDASPNTALSELVAFLEGVDASRAEAADLQRAGAAPTADGY